jgi:formiminoglutamase
MSSTKTATLVGCPDDRGVYNNGGRTGARNGPAAFRQWLNKPKGAHEVQSRFIDRGNVSPITTDIAGTHEKVAQQITEAHQKGHHSLVIGGGHDYAHAHLKGLKNNLREEQHLGCINIDPHFDLRAYQTDILSGSPFYMAIEEHLLEGKHLVEFGIQHFCNGAQLWDYAQEHHVKTYTREAMRFSGVLEQFRSALDSLAGQCQQIAISLDLDAINMAYAPGVSAPNVEGFSPSEVLALMGEAARFEAVTSLGIYELNPRFDQDAHTARLASTAAFTFFDHKFNT